MLAVVKPVWLLGQVVYITSCSDIIFMLLSSLQGLDQVMRMIIALQASLSVYKPSTVYQTPGCVTVTTTVETGKMRTLLSVVRSQWKVEQTAHSVHQVCRPPAVDHSSGVKVAIVSTQGGCVTETMIVGIILMSRIVVGGHMIHL